MAFIPHDLLETDLHAAPPLEAFDGDKTQPIEPLPMRCYELEPPRWTTPDRPLAEILADEWKRRTEWLNLKNHLRQFGQSLGRPY